ELTATDDVQVVVKPENQPPVVNAGTDQTVTLPSSASLQGIVSDDGLPPGSQLTLSWTVVSGSGTVTFANSGAAQTTASFSTAGSYTLRLTANDSQLTSSDDVVVTVIAQNQAPAVNAGPDQSIALPASAELVGSATGDGLPTGSSLAVQWSTV